LSIFRLSSLLLVSFVSLISHPLSSFLCRRVRDQPRARDSCLPTNLNQSHPMVIRLAPPGFPFVHSPLYLPVLPLTPMLRTSACAARRHAAQCALAGRGGDPTKTPRLLDWLCQGPLCRHSPAVADFSPLHFFLPLKMILIFCRILSGPVACRCFVAPELFLLFPLPFFPCLSFLVKSRSRVS